MTDVNWSDEIIASLKRLWAKGLSASEIAAELGITRNAVIGKVHRLGLSGRQRSLPVQEHSLAGASVTPQPKPRANKPVKTSSRSGVHVAAPRPTVTRVTNHGNRFDRVEVFAPKPVRIMASVDDLNIPAEQRCALADLDAARCRWPVGEPNAPGFFFCGAPTVTVEVVGARFEPIRQLPYCAGHWCRSVQSGRLPGPIVATATVKPRVARGMPTPEIEEDDQHDAMVLVDEEIATISP